jgi:hypothetical protein
VRYRRLDSQGDYSFGHGLGDFYVNVPAAPAQAVATRLALYLAEWFLDISDGTAWKTRVLGKYTDPTYDMEVRSRILGTPGILGIVAGTYNSHLDRTTRRLTIACEVNTIYGKAPVAANLTIGASVEIAR